jgi:hypothetical protein
MLIARIKYKTLTDEFDRTVEFNNFVEFIRYIWAHWTYRQFLSFELTLRQLPLQKRKLLKTKKL